jgi:Uma2 family endonuclease
VFYAIFTGGEVEVTIMDLTTKGRASMNLLPESLPTVIPADHIPGPSQGHWTYKDYAAIPDDGRQYEVVDGVLFISPSPNIGHQDVVGALFAYLWNYVNLGTLGRVYSAPLDVELATRTICQPDVIVILNANLSKLSGKHIIGAPDLVIEVASPATALYDRNKKLNAYARSGIKEYWIADPIEHIIEVFFLEDAHYHFIGTFAGKTLIPSKILPDFSIQVEKFFAFVSQ